MKKLALLLSLSSIFLLAGCDQVRTLIRGEEYAQKYRQSEDQEKLLKELNQTDLPQLSTEIGDNEAAVKLVTSEGDITIKLFPEYAPLAVENFLTHAKEGYYDGLTFHRVIDNFMIQGGDPDGTGTGGESIWNGVDDSIDSGNGFQDEFSAYLYNIRGALSMANAGENTNGSQFFIVQNSDNMASGLSNKVYPEKIIEAYKDGGAPHLDGAHTVFGQVIEGMAIVDKIASVEVDSSTSKPVKDVTIDRIEIIKDYSFK